MPLVFPALPLHGICWQVSHGGKAPGIRNLFAPWLRHRVFRLSPCSRVVATRRKRNANAQPVSHLAIQRRKAQFATDARAEVSHRLPRDSQPFPAESRRCGSPGDLGDFFSTHAHEIERRKRREAECRKRENRRRGSLPRLPNVPEALIDRAGAGTHVGAKAPIWETSGLQSQIGGGRTRVFFTGTSSPGGIAPASKPRALPPRVKLGSPTDRPPEGPFSDEIWTRVGHEFLGEVSRPNFPSELVVLLVSRLVSFWGYFRGILCHLAVFPTAENRLTKSPVTR
jgi:hypothetical protein